MKKDENERLKSHQPLPGKSKNLLITDKAPSLLQIWQIKKVGKAC